MFQRKVDVEILMVIVQIFKPMMNRFAHLASLGDLATRPRFIKKEKQLVRSHQKVVSGGL